MGKIMPFNKQKLFMGLIYRRDDLRTKLLNHLIKIFGPIDCYSERFNFDMTDYYENEFGRDLFREFISFEKPVDPGKLFLIKIKTNRIEERFSDKKNQNRYFNIDPGLVSPGKVIVATTKDYSHRLPLRDGIYAEVALMFRDGSFTPWQWTYPDYRTRTAIDFFNTLGKNTKNSLARKII